MAGRGYLQVAAARESAGLPQDAARTQEQPGASGDLLVEACLRLWAFSKMSATVAQEICHVGHMSGLTGECINKMASMGSWGQHTKNCGRDIKRYFFKKVLLPALDKLRLQFSDTHSHEALTWGTTGVLSPSKLFRILSTHYPEEFSSMLGVAKAEAFWREHRMDDPRFDGNPMVEVPDWQKLFTPIFVHGDGGEFQNRDSMVTLSFGGCLADGATIDSMMWFCSWAKSCTAKASADSPGSMHFFFNKFVHELNQLYEGDFSYVDDNGDDWPPGSLEDELAGQQICPNGERFNTWASTGDLEWMNSGMGLPCHPNALRCCPCVKVCVCYVSLPALPVQLFLPVLT